MDKREEEVLRFSVQIFLSHSTQKLRRGSLLCSRKILVSKNVRDKRGGEYHNFPSKLFCFSVPKTFVGESFSVSLISGIKKIWIRGGGRKYRDFPSTFFCLTVPKTFVGEPFCVPENFWCRNFLGTKRGRISQFPIEFFLLHSAENFLKGTL